MDIYKKLEDEKLIPNRTIILGYVGSIAHGTNVPKEDPNSIDDVDLMGICISNPNVYLGLRNFEQLDIQKDEWDIVVYDIKKYIRLLVKQNPNVISLLWLPTDKYLTSNESMDLLIKNRSIFLSKDLYNSFTGYAYAQLHKMTHFSIDPYKAYMGKKRKELVDKFGFDTKNAGHLIRLMRMCCEFFDTGIINVDRASIDAEELKLIKTGKKELQWIKEESERLFILAKELKNKSNIQDHVDIDKAEDILMQVMKIEGFSWK